MFDYAEKWYYKNKNLFVAFLWTLLYTYVLYMLCMGCPLVVVDTDKQLCDCSLGIWLCLHIVLVYKGLYISVLYMLGAVDILDLTHILALVL